MNRIISVRGGNRHQRGLVYTAAAYCANTMMPRTHFSVNISIRRLVRDQLHGYCMQIDSRDFEVSVCRSLSNTDIVITVCHEMTHVMQFCRGILKSENHRTWHNKPYNGKAEYPPWERQAYHIEQLLLKKFLKHHNMPRRDLDEVATQELCKRYNFYN